MTIRSDNNGINEIEILSSDASMYIRFYQNVQYYADTMRPLFSLLSEIPIIALGVQRPRLGPYRMPECLFWHPPKQILVVSTALPGHLPL